jgi:hypothetical protein
VNEQTVPHYDLLFSLLVLSSLVLQARRQIRQMRWRLGRGAIVSAVAACVIGLLANPLFDLTRMTPSHYTAFAQAAGGGIALTPGWQLVSIPVVPGNTSPAAVLSSIDGHYEEAQAFDGCAASPTRVFDPTATTGNTLTVIDQRIGVWIKMTSPGTLSVSGTPPTNTSLQLCRGLNLVGYPLAEPLPITSVLAPIAGKFSRVYGLAQARAARSSTCASARTRPAA